MQKLNLCISSEEKDLINKEIENLKFSLYTSNFIFLEDAICDRERS